MGCSCSRENAFKVINSSKLDKKKIENDNIASVNRSSSILNNPATTKYTSGKQGNNSLNGTETKSNGFTLHIYCGFNDKKQLFMNSEKGKDFNTLMNILNKLLFENSNFDVNFTSKYCPNKDDYEYFIQRINEFEADEEIGSYDQYIKSKYSKNPTKSEITQSNYKGKFDRESRSQKEGEYEELEDEEDNYLHYKNNNYQAV